MDRAAFQTEQGKELDRGKLMDTHPLLQKLDDLLHTLVQGFVPGGQHLFRRRGFFIRLVDTREACNKSTCEWLF